MIHLPQLLPANQPPRNQSKAAIPVRTPSGEACELAVFLVADAFQIAPKHLLGPTRGTPPHAHARQAAMYLAHVALGVPVTAIGAFFRRDHSTVAHACRRVEDRRDDLVFDLTMAELALSARVAAHLDREVTA
ncbi:MAG TPA: helix-turn-helix domain-containing protein [Xanthobacteraceae bacterium]|nr:helix-turn-helix domain-containing protein [Xanthobacteraceae bacterium]